MKIYPGAPTEKGLVNDSSAYGGRASLRAWGALERAGDQCVPYGEVASVRRTEDQKRKLPSGYSEFGILDGCVDIDLFEIPNNDGRRLRPSYPEGHHQAANTAVVLEVNDIG